MCPAGLVCQFCSTVAGGVLPLIGQVAELFCQSSQPFALAGQWRQGVHRTLMQAGQQRSDLAAAVGINGKIMVAGQARHQDGGLLATGIASVRQGRAGGRHGQVLMVGQLCEQLQVG